VNMNFSIRLCINVSLGKGKLLSHRAMTDDKKPTRDDVQYAPPTSESTEDHELFPPLSNLPVFDSNPHGPQGQLKICIHERKHRSLRI
jgi:hypothetical protein